MRINDIGAEQSQPAIIKRREQTGIPTTKAEFADLIDTYSRQLGIDPALARAVATTESGIGQNATSKAGAVGIMQLMPETAKELGVDPSDPEQNIRGGLAYLQQMLRRYDGDASLALAAYNAGPGNVDRYDGIPPFKETQQYVSKVLGIAMKYREAGFDEDEDTLTVDGILAGQSDGDGFSTIRVLMNGAGKTIAPAVSIDNPEEMARRLLANSAYMSMRLLSGEKDEG